MLASATGPQITNNLYETPQYLPCLTSAQKADIKMQSHAPEPQKYTRQQYQYNCLRDHHRGYQMFIMLVSKILGTKQWVVHNQYRSRKHQRRNQRLIDKGFAMQHLMRKQGVQCDDTPPKKDRTSCQLNTQC